VPPSILLHVDEQPELPNGVANDLRREGYELLHTADPEEAMRFVEERRPDLVLMEIELEGCDGIDLMAGIRDLQPDSLPVLVVTRAPRDSALHGEAIALGVADFLTKPVRAAELLAAIHEIVPPPREPGSTPKPTRTAEGAHTAAGLTGNLSDTPMPELLARLRRRGANGVLAVGHAGIRVGVQLRNGSPVGVSSSRRSPERVAEVLLFETFSWEEGRYAFSEARRLEPEATDELAGDPAGLLLAGVLDASPARQIRERLAKRESLYVSITEESESALEAEGVTFSRRQRKLLESLGGADTLSVLVESKAFDERLVYALWVGGWLRLDTVPTLTMADLLGDTAELEPELDESGQEGTEQAAKQVAEEAEAVAKQLRLRKRQRAAAKRAAKDEAAKRAAEEAEAAAKQAAEKRAAEETAAAVKRAAEKRAADEAEAAAKRAADEAEAAAKRAAAKRAAEEAAVAAKRAAEEAEAAAKQAAEKRAAEEAAAAAKRAAEEAEAAAKQAAAKRAAEEAAVAEKRAAEEAEAAAKRAAEKRAAEEAAVAAKRAAEEAEAAAKQADPIQVESAPKGVEIAPFKAPPTDDRDSLSRSLCELAERVLASDDFEALGITPSASDQEVRSAYEGILADIPEIEPTAANLMLVQRAKRISSRIDAAYANLRDEEKRRAYSLMREEEEQDRKQKPSAERALEGERWFRKGKAHLEQRRCAEAVEAFGMASHLDPEQGEYVSHLGYALYLSNPNDEVVQGEAMEHVACGIKRSPKHELSYVYLGRILKAKGDTEVAKKIFLKALRIKPDFHPAVRELRLLEMRERKGVFSRLLRR
jgi:CheY-like chemotaxis protein